MPQTLEIDVDQIMEQIRQNSSKRQLEMPPSDATTPLTETQMPADIALLQSSYDIYHLNFVSHRQVLGRVVLFAKNVLRQLLTPILERQVAFNAATARVAQYLWERPEGIQQQQAATFQRLQQTLETFELRQTAALQALSTEMFEAVQAVRRSTADVLGGFELRAAQIEDRVATLEQAQQDIVVKFEQAQQDNVKMLELVRQDSAVKFEQAQQDNVKMLELVRQDSAVKFEQAQQDNVKMLELVRQDSAVKFEQAQQDNVKMLELVRQDSISRYEQIRQDNTERLERNQKDSAAHIGRVLGDQGRQLAEWDKALSYLKTELIMQERRITILLEEARKRLPDPWNNDQLQGVADEGKHALEALYVSFEDQFRGTREDIKSRFRVYLPLLQEAKLGTDQLPILDVGCGRGEWLELLKEEGLRAQGVYLNRVLIEECHRRGLETIESEAVSYLSSLPQHSMAAVTGFHIIEHLPLDTLISLLDETVRILKPGGVAIFETPNPENVLVGSHNFYLDPTHRDPLLSATIKFLVEARGLCRVEIINLHPYPESQQVEDTGLDIVTRFNQYFYGPQDYAVVGWKVS